MSEKKKEWDLSNLSLEGEEAPPTSGKARFDVEEAPAGALYQGPERRRGHRRKTPDRRSELRFEEKKDRRSGKDRRKGIWDDIYRI